MNKALDNWWSKWSWNKTKCSLCAKTERLMQFWLITVVHDSFSASEHTTDVIDARRYLWSSSTFANLSREQPLKYINAKILYSSVKYIYIVTINTACYCYIHCIMLLCNVRVIWVLFRAFTQLIMWLKRHPVCKRRANYSQRFSVGQVEE